MVTEFNALSSPLEGRNLIEASAGTGKTYTISALFLRLVLEQELGVDQILVVTFTVSATQELKARIRTVLNDALRAFSLGGSDDVFLDGIVKRSGNKQRSMELLRDAINTLDEANIYTIHGFCNRVLMDNAFESKALFDTELITDQSELVKEVLSDFWRREIATKLPEEVVAYFGLRPDELLGFLTKALAYQDANVVMPSAPPSASEVDRTVAEYRDAFKELKEGWLKYRGEIADIFHGPGLYKNIYGDGKADKFIRCMDEYVASDGMGLPLFKDFKRFTTNGIKCTKDYDVPRHEFFDLCERLYEKTCTLSDVADRYALYLKGELILFARKELKQRKQRLNVQYFDDLLSSVRDALDGKGKADLIQSIRSKYRAVLVDEFQDTDPVQYAIFSRLFERDTILFLIGDPKQAIYSFRGADIFSYIKASKNVDNKYTLSRNWRSSPGLIDAVNTIFINADNPFVYDDIPYTPVQAAEAESETLEVVGDSDSPLRLCFLEHDGQHVIPTREMAERLVVDAVVSEISRLLNLSARQKAHIVCRSPEPDSRPLKPGDIAVLVSTHAQAREVRDRLKDLGIHSVIHSDLNVFDSHEASEMARVLAGIENPGNESLVKASLATDIMGFKSQGIERFMEAEKDWEDVLIRFQDYHESWLRHGFFKMFRTFLSREGVPVRLLSLKDGERRLTNVLHLAELLHQASIERKLGMGGLLKWFYSEMDPSTTRLDENQLRLESDEDALKVVTIHKSKGLEYQVVFCPFLWRLSVSVKEKALMFHDKDMVLNIDLDLDKSNPNRKIAEREILAENIRLMYVALTRAKSRCYLYWGFIKNSGKSPPSYLFHLKGTRDLFPQDAAEDRFKKLDPDIALNDLKGLAEKSNKSIQVVNVQPVGKVSRYDSPVEPRELVLKKLSRPISTDWRIASYTYLISGATGHNETIERDIDLQEDVVITDHGTIDEMVDSRLDMFSFPRGRHPGICLHKIMECLDYSSNDRTYIEKLVGEKLLEYGFDRKWIGPIYSMIDNVLNVPLEHDNGSIRLSLLNKGDWLNELRFFFPIDRINTKVLEDVFKGNYDDFTKRLSLLGFRPARGFMLGYIDMVFSFNGRFYLIDWKSDFLGNRMEDYQGDKLARAMEAHYYVLQYHIYTLALHNYLKMRLNNYSYKRHFGGVYYIFLRGVDPGHPGCGIYSDRPDIHLIERLGSTLMGGKTLWEAV